MTRGPGDIRRLSKEVGPEWDSRQERTRGSITGKCLNKYLFNLGMGFGIFHFNMLRQASDRKARTNPVLQSKQAISPRLSDCKSVPVNIFLRQISISPVCFAVYSNLQDTGGERYFPGWCRVHI